MNKIANESIIKVGERNYRVVENIDMGRGVKVYSLDGIPVTASVKVFWWDLEGILNLINQNMPQIEEKLRTIKR